MSTSRTGIEKVPCGRKVLTFLLLLLLVLKHKSQLPGAAFPKVLYHSSRGEAPLIHIHKLGGGVEVFKVEAGESDREKFSDTIQPSLVFENLKQERANGFRWVLLRVTTESRSGLGLDTLAGEFLVLSALKLFSFFGVHG
jgi:hypothetical protein